MTLSALQELVGRLAIYTAAETAKLTERDRNNSRSAISKLCGTATTDRDVDQHLSSMASSAATLSRAKYHTRFANELHARATFKCEDCAKPTCAKNIDGIRSNLARGGHCVSDLKKHFGELVRAAHWFVRTYGGLDPAPEVPAIALDLKIVEHIPNTVRYALFARHDRSPVGHRIVLEVIPNRFDEHVYFAVTAEVFRVLVSFVWNGESDESADPFTEGWMMHAAHVAFIAWLDEALEGDPQIDLREKELRKKHASSMYVERTSRETPLGVPDRNKLALGGAAAAVDFYAHLRSNLTERNAQELFLNWSFGLLVRAPPERRTVIVAETTQFEEIIGTFPRGWTWISAWQRYVDISSIDE